VASMKMPTVLSPEFFGGAIISRMRLAEIRKKRGLTQVELADLAGCEQATVSRVERGSEAVTLRQLRQLADALRVTVADLFLDDRSAAEVMLVRAFRSLPEDRRQGWLDLARAVVLPPPPDGK
jgi:transcriptional regulator with XRE-family HTH domain